MPVSQADIYVYEYHKGKRLSKNDIGDKITQTDTMGYFEIDPSTIHGLSNQPLYKITASVKENDSIMKNSVIGIHLNQKEVVIILERKQPSISEIYGRVVDAMNQPVSDFNVNLSHNLQASLTNIKSIVDRMQYNSGDGAFYIKNIHTDQIQMPIFITVYSKDHGISLSEPIYLKPMEVKKDVIITMSSKVILKGKVVDGKTNEPIPNAQIWYSLSQEQDTEEQIFSRIRRVLPRRGLSGNVPYQRYIKTISTNEQGKFTYNVQKAKLWLHIKKGIKYYPLKKYIDARFSSNTINLNLLKLKRVNR
ncbi:hypothetical protein GF373_14520 [bacterium]|nr:hypothetical protein [bacterium]